VRCIEVESSRRNDGPFKQREGYQKSTALGDFNSFPVYVFALLAALETI
jgi:hypothetical protein